MKRKVQATFCFFMSMVVAFHIYVSNPLGIKDMVDLPTYLLIHVQVHNLQYLFPVACFSIGLLLLTWPQKQELLSVDFSIPLTKPEQPEQPEREIIEGLLEIRYEGRWVRVLNHQLNEWLSDSQITALKELEEWRQAQNPITKSEVEAATEEFFTRKDQIVKTRPARMKVSHDRPIR